MGCKWLPEFYHEPDWNHYAEYEEKLYVFFKNIYLARSLVFRNEKVQFRRHPKVNNKEEVFYHIICKVFINNHDRQPDRNRIIRIEWPNAFIENYLCDEECCNDKPLYWVKSYNNKLRHKIYFNNYIVILEKRDNCYLFITGFYVEEEYYRRGILKEYNKSY